jgi:hypothetical protein
LEERLMLGKQNIWEINVWGGQLNARPEIRRDFLRRCVRQR